MKKAERYAENQTGIPIQIFQTDLKNFKDNLLTKNDHVLGSATETGFPVFNNKSFYEEIYNGWRKINAINPKQKRPG